MRSAIIGAGRIAQQHLSCLAELPNAQLVGVCDLSSALAEATAERFGVERHFTDLERMLDEARPEIVHITTPAPSHFAIAARVLEQAHVFIEKPLTSDPADGRCLIDLARTSGHALVEDHNYVFNDSIQQVLALLSSGSFGEVVHVEVFLAVDILAPGSGFADVNLPHPALSARGGPVSDFITHLASLAHAFIGPATSASTAWATDSQLPEHEMRALVYGPRGSAAIAFSPHAKPDAFTVRVHGTKMRATAQLFEPRLTLERVRDVPRPLVPVLNGLGEARAIAQASIAGLGGKLSGRPGGYEGLWRLIRGTHEALASGSEPPVALQDVAEVNALVELLVSGDGRR